MLSFELPGDAIFTEQAKIDEVFADPGFGVHFTDHMAVADWSITTGWGNDRIVTNQPLGLGPGSAVFHYAQEVFEGLKAYRHTDGSVWLFRPEKNGERLANSAHRLALPQLPVEDFLTSVRNLVTLDERWVPAGHEQSLYLRPFIVAKEDFLGVRPAQDVSYILIASPVGSYFTGGVAPVNIWVSREYSRVANGGTGHAKCGGNYAASLLPQELAHEQGCSQVLFVDNAQKRWVEELGGMNFFMVTASGQLVTPDLNGNILPGVTRDSILTIAPELGLTPVERPVELAEVTTGIADGSVTEIFACGTAAVITPIGSLKDVDGTHRLEVREDSATMALRNYLLDIQYGRRADERNWMVRVR